MNKIPLLFVIVLFLGACKKDYVVIDSVQDYTQLEIGNYWVYEVRKFNSIVVDSSVVTGDSIINGKRYKVVEGHNFFGDWDIINIVRDSSNYLVNYLGNILFSPTNLTDVIHERHEINQMDTIFSILYSMKKEVAVVHTPAGNFGDILNYQGELNNYSSSPSSPIYKYDNNYYSKGVGLVKSVSNFAFSRDSIEKKLLRYYVK